MFSTENKNLIITYLITLVVMVSLMFLIINFNRWFFPDYEAETNTLTPASRGLVNQKDLRFGVLSDKKFIALEPILLPGQIIEEQVTNQEGITLPVRPQTSKELRHSNPFEPF